MDEPTVGIDPQSRNHILESTRQIAARGTTVVYTTHYMEEVQALCKQIAIMDLGRVIAEGSLEDLVGRLQHEQTIQLTALQASEALTADLQAIASVKQVTLKGSTYNITSASGAGDMNRIIEIAQRHGGVGSISENKPNLENVFLTLTGKKLRDEGEV